MRRETVARHPRGVTSAMPPQGPILPGPAWGRRAKAATVLCQECHIPG